MSRAGRSDGDLTKSKILDAAGRLIAQDGFAKTTSKAIAKLAEVDLAAINYHFDGRDGLLDFVVNGQIGLGFEAGDERIVDAPQVTAMELVSSREVAIGPPAFGRDHRDVAHLSKLACCAFPNVLHEGASLPAACATNGPPGVLERVAGRFTVRVESRPEFFQPHVAMLRPEAEQAACVMVFLALLPSP